MKNHSFVIRTLVILFSVFCSGMTTAETGKISLGMSSALTGPASALGKGVLNGAEAYFAAVNLNGGINGQTISITALDDGYEPTRTKPNMHTLLEDDKILAIMGNVGTPTAMVSVPLVNSQKTLLFGAYTGAGVLRKTPPERYIINYRASYAEETAEMVSGLLRAGINPSEIAFFTQDDGYGQAGYKGATEALKQHGFLDVHSLAHGLYKRNTTNVQSAVDKILDHEVTPRAIIMVGAYKPCTSFIREVRQFLPQVHFLNVSFVGSRALLNHLGPDSEGVIVTQVVPHPESDLPLVRNYRENLSTYNNSLKPDFVSLEGYIIARIFSEGLKLAGNNPTRESIIDALESIQNLDIGLGKPISFDSNEHQASHQVWPTVIQNGKYVDLNWDSLKGDQMW